VSTGSGTWGSIEHPVRGSGVNRGEDTAGVCEEDGVAVMVDNGKCPGGSVGVSAGVLVSGEEVVSVTQPPVSTMKTIPIRIAG